jgi:hypothetical protein
MTRPHTPPPDAAAAMQHKMAFDAIGFAAQLLTPQADTLAALIEAEMQMHSYMHITDPTLYRRAIHDKGLAQQVRLAKAALAFVLEVQAVKDELTGAGAHD